jgi:endonuclease/exonuclease/phosphatase (EEP) superfamily protein YafD
MYPHADLSSPPPVVAAGRPKAALPRQGIDVLVWNVKKAQRAAWPQEFAALVPGKALVLLQEAYLAPRMTEPLAARSDLEWLMSPSFTFARRRGEPTTGVVIGSAARAVQSRAFLTTDTEPLAGTPKAAFAATYVLEGEDERLLVVCVHGINFRPARALLAQLGALEPVIRAHRGPVILAGDLNTHHRARMDVVEELAARHGLTSVFDNRRNGVAKSALDGRRRHRGWALDHVYVRGLVVEDARVVVGGRGSDHPPMLVRLSRPPVPVP